MFKNEKITRFTIYCEKSLKLNYDAFYIKDVYEYLKDFLKIEYNTQVKLKKLGIHT